MISMSIESIRLDTVTRQPVVILSNDENALFLPIWIGAYEATAIAMELEGIKSSRPMTHDLVMDIFSALEVILESVLISDLVNGTYFARIRLSNSCGKYEIDARPSDAIALALRAKVPIYASDDLGREMLPLQKDEEDEDRKKREMEEFRSFIEDIKPEDFL